MVVQSVAKGIKISPRKVGVVAALVRNRTVEDALVILQHTPRRAAQPVAKAIASAKANAENNHNLKPDTLVIDEIYVNPGTRLKRYRPAARGRALPYQKRTSNVTVRVVGEERVAKKKTEKEAK